ncbi:hypothetical protein DKX38_028066 [Salix brachista]|uniref:DUF4283 domain-containing protein n=1 Tax=Salix brachista TaxID=2182728 RepID=A0A5N5J894_9ROSI|nr:hypothetical protein DKX38_028066 [Salix brachista]
MATSRSTQVQQQQPRTWADKVRVSDSSSRCKLDKLPRQPAGTVLNIPKDMFMSEEAIEEVLARGPWMFGGKTILLQKWKPGFQFDKNKIRSLPVWARLHGLPFPLWTTQCLSMAASMLGKPLACDESTLQGRRMEYARVCVEIEVDTPLVHHFPVASSLTEQPLVVEVTYEWKPTRCAFCKVFGHSCKPKEDLGKGKEGQREADRGQEQEDPTPLGNLNKEAKESRQSEPVTSNKEPITAQPSAHIHDKAEGSTKLDEAQTGLRCKEKAKGIMEDQMGLGIESMMDSGHTSEGGAEAEASGCSTSAGTSAKNNGSSTTSPKATKKKKGAKKRRAAQSPS